MDIPVGAEELAVDQSQIVAFVDGKAVKVAVAGGVSDLGGGDGGGGVQHGLGDDLGIGLLGVGVHHGGDALGHGGGGDDDDFLLRQTLALLSGHDDVLVVGQHEHHLAGGQVDLLEDGLGGGVHGLAAADDAVRTQVAEGGFQTLAGTHGQEAVPLFGGSEGDLLLGGSHGLFVIQIVGADGLFAGGHIVGLDAHVLDLADLQNTVLLGLVDGVAGDVGVDVDLEGVVVFADDQAVADAVEVFAQAGEIHVLAGLADDEHGVEGEGDVLFADGGKVGLLPGFLHLGDLLATQGAQHAFQDHQITLTAGIHHAGLLQHGVHVGGLCQHFVTGLDGLGQHILGTVVLAGGVGGADGGQAGNGEHRTLGGLHHGAVGGGHTLLQGSGQGRAVQLLQTLGGLGDAAEEEGQDHAGVAACAAQQGAGGDLGGFGHGGRLALAQLGGGGLDGEAHVGAGVAVGHREYIQVIDRLFLRLDAGGAKEHHLLKRAAVDSICHVDFSPLAPITP